MADIVPKNVRSKLMSVIRSRGNKSTELKLISILKSHAFSGWRRQATIPGKPDFIFPSAKLAIFVDGCFWHGCRWHCRMPKSRQAYWGPKIARNKGRDHEINLLLKKRGWRVHRIWEHSLRNPPKVVARLNDFLRP